MSLSSHFPWTLFSAELRLDLCRCQSIMSPDCWGFGAAVPAVTMLLLVKHLFSAGPTGWAGGCFLDTVLLVPRLGALSQPYLMCIHICLVVVVLGILERGDSP